MNEDRIPFLATPGGKTDTIARAIMAERVAAQKARREYLKSKGEDCLNLLGSESRVSGLIYKPGAIPDGWRRDAAMMRKYRPDNGGVIAVPDKKKPTYNDLQRELSSIPSLPDAHSFSNRIGFHFMIRDNRWKICGFERIGESIVVEVPKWTPRNPEYDGEDDHNAQFVPPDSTQLKHSEYYTMKEATPGSTG
jgi:hypothetical protein